jgi:hypothetical protein
MAEVLLMQIQIFIVLHSYQSHHNRVREEATQ